MLNKVLSVVAVALFAAAGCGGGDDTTGDVLIIVPDNGSADVAVDSNASSDEGGVRDVEAADAGADSAVPVDAGMDTAEDDANEPSDVISDSGWDAGPRCFLGNEMCDSAASDLKTCATAAVIGRRILATTNAYKRNAETLTDNGNDDELDKTGCPVFSEGDDPWCSNDCDDDGKDHFFRVYLIPGDWFSLSISDTLVYNSEEYYHTNIDSILKVYKGDLCPLEREALLYCTDNKHSGSANVENIQIKPMTDEEAGWYTVVVDGIDDENAGTYTIEARLFQNSDYTGDWSLCCDY